MQTQRCSRGTVSVVATLLSMVVACSSGSTAPTPLTGSYELVSVDNQNLPTSRIGCCSIERGELELTADRFQLTLWVRNPQFQAGVPFEVIEEGTFTLSDSRLVLLSERASPYPLQLSTAARAGSVLIVPFGGDSAGAPDQLTARFRRRP